MQLDVVTPRGRVLSEEVDEVAAPGVLGEFGVLPGHIPFLTGLKPGVLRYRKTGGGDGVLALGPGFVEVSHGDRIIVLADQGAKPDAIDVEAARKERDMAQHDLDHWDKDDPGLRAATESRRAWAEAQLAAAGATTAPTAH